MGSINNIKPLCTFNFSSKFFSERWESNPGQLGPEASLRTIVVCCPPPSTEILCGKSCLARDSNPSPLPSCRIRLAALPFLKTAFFLQLDKLMGLDLEVQELKAAAETSDEEAEKLRLKNSELESKVERYRF